MTFCRVLFQIWAQNFFPSENIVCMPLNDNGSINGLWESNLEEFNTISAKVKYKKNTSNSTKQLNMLLCCRGETDVYYEPK
jgi:hypothetical protein